MKRVASLVKARLIMEAWPSMVGWNQVRVLIGLRHVRPYTLAQSVRACP